MKKVKLMPVLLALLLAGCVPAAVAEPEATPAPIKITVISAADSFPEFVLTHSTDEMFMGEEEGPEEGACEITLLYMPDADVLQDIACEGVVLTDDPSDVPGDMSVVQIDNDAAVLAAWDALYNYPAHSTPIRTLLLTENGLGLSHKTFLEMRLEGKLQDKGSYNAILAEQGAEEWVAERLAEIPVGLLDTIYADSEELAIAAYNALRAAERNDSVEVICPVLTEKLVELMIEDHWSMGACVGVGMEQEAEAMVELAQTLAQTGEAETVTLEPVVVYSEDVKALVDSGVTDPAEIMNILTK